MGYETYAWNFWHFPVLPNLLCAILFTTFYNTEESSSLIRTLPQKLLHRPGENTIKQLEREQQMTLGLGTQENTGAPLR